MEEQKQGLITALYANGMIGGDDLKQAIADITESHDAACQQIAQIFETGAIAADEEAEDFATDLWWEKAKPG